MKFMIVGTAKAGTTSIFHQLNTRYYIPQKETFYFAKDRIQTGQYEYPQQRPGSSIITSEKAYHALYKNNNTGVQSAEVSTCYLYYYLSVIPQLLNQHGRDLKIIICLRNPVDRTKSGYLHFRREGFETLELEEAITAIPERINNGYDFMWDYVGLSQYTSAIKAYQANFKSVQIVFFEDLKQNPQFFYQQMLSFIEDRPVSFESEKIEHQNKSGIMKNAWLFKAMKQSYNSLPFAKSLATQLLGEERLRVFRRGVKEQFYAANSANEFPIDRAFLTNLFEEEVQQLEELLQQDLSKKWKDFQSVSIG